MTWTMPFRLTGLRRRCAAGRKGSLPSQVPFESRSWLPIESGGDWPIGRIGASGTKKPHSVMRLSGVLDRRSMSLSRGSGFRRCRSVFSGGGRSTLVVLRSRIRDHFATTGGGASARAAAAGATAIETASLGCTAAGAGCLRSAGAAAGGVDSRGAEGAGAAIATGSATAGSTSTAASVATRGATAGSTVSATTTSVAAGSGTVASTVTTRSGTARSTAAGACAALLDSAAAATASFCIRFDHHEADCCSSCHQHYFTRHCRHSSEMVLGL